MKKLMLVVLISMLTGCAFSDSNLMKPNTKLEEIEFVDDNVDRGTYLEDTEDITVIQNYEERKSFVDYFSQDEVLCLNSEEEFERVFFDDLDVVSYEYMELTDSNIPILLIYDPRATHAIGNFQVWLIDEETNMPEYMVGLDSIEAVFQQAGLILMCHWGGGEGETTTCYLKVHDNNVELVGKTLIMKNEDFAKMYEESYKIPYEDKYLLGSHTEEKEISKNEFEEWFDEQVYKSNCIKNIEWKTIKEISNILLSN